MSVSWMRGGEIGGVASRKRKKNCEGPEGRWSLASSRNQKEVECKEQGGGEIRLEPRTKGRACWVLWAPGQGLGFTPKSNGQLLKPSLPLPVSSF